MQISIRRAEPDDYQQVHDVFKQPRVIRGTLQLQFPSAEVWRRRLMEKSEEVVLLVATVEGRVIGQVGLHLQPNVSRRRHAAQLGMAVHDQWQGKGVGSALLRAAIDLADNWLNLSRLELDVYVDNEPAIRLYRKFGFSTEGRLERFAYRDGEYVDAFLMARIKREGEN